MPAETMRMKILRNDLRTVFTLAICVFASSGVNANVSLDDTNETSFDIGGNISAECKVTNTATDAATSLDLSSTSAQNASSVAVWCNTGQNSANTTYASLNDGFLVSENGNRIAYNINVGEQGNNLSLTSPQSVQQSNGTGTSGDTFTTDVAIMPQVSGFETSGIYNDTIAVTVSYN